MILAQTCRQDDFTCDDGECIHESQRCDRRRDCRDGSDENNCGSQSGPDSGSQQGCPPGHYQCPLGGDCIPTSAICDGRSDCPDQSDEYNCRKYFKVFNWKINQKASFDVQKFVHFVFLNS